MCLYMDENVRRAETIQNAPISAANNQSELPPDRTNKTHTQTHTQRETLYTTLHTLLLSTCLLHSSKLAWIPFQSLIFIVVRILPTDVRMASKERSLADFTTRTCERATRRPNPTIFTHVFFFHAHGMHARARKRERETRVDQRPNRI